MVNISLGGLILLHIAFGIEIIVYIFVLLYIRYLHQSLLDFHLNHYDYGRAYNYHQYYRDEVRGVFVV